MREALGVAPARGRGKIGVDLDAARTCQWADEFDAVRGDPREIAFVAAHRLLACVEASEFEQRLDKPTHRLRGSLDGLEGLTLLLAQALAGEAVLRVGEHDGGGRAQFVRGVGGEACLLAVEASHFFEWGGKQLDGRSTFAEKRPGWAAPIHDLLAKRGGAVVFHGHDHLYVRGERDGVIYQLVPQPGHSRFDNTRSAEEYGYKSGVIAGASGIMRIGVSAEKAVVDYVRAYPVEAESAESKTGSVSHSYEVRPR